MCSRGRLVVGSSGWFRFWVRLVVWGGCALGGVWRLCGPGGFAFGSAWRFVGWLGFGGRLVGVWSGGFRFWGRLVVLGWLCSGSGRGVLGGWSVVGGFGWVERKQKTNKNTVFFVGPLSKRCIRPWPNLRSRLRYLHSTTQTHGTLPPLGPQH